MSPGSRPLSMVFSECYRQRCPPTLDPRTFHRLMLTMRRCCLSAPWRWLTVILLSLLLTAALWIMIMFALQGFIRPNLRGRSFVCVFDTIDKCTNWFVSAVSRRLFGLKDNTKGERTSYSENAGPEEEDWAGRMHYLEHRFQAMLSEAKNELQNDIRTLELVSDGRRRCCICAEFRAFSVLTCFLMSQRLNENGMDICRRGSVMS
jgi:hypothetical protein